MDSVIRESTINRDRRTAFRADSFNGRRKATKKKMKKQTSLTTRLPSVKTNTTNSKYGRNTTTKISNTNNISSNLPTNLSNNISSNSSTNLSNNIPNNSSVLANNIGTKQKAKADFWKYKNNYGNITKSRNRFSTTNRIDLPLMSAIDRRLLDSFESYGHPNNSKRQFLFSNNALDIKPITLRPRTQKLRELRYKAKNDFSVKKGDCERIASPLFPNLSAGFQVEPLYMYSPPSFSPSDEVNSLAFLLDGISLSPPPPSELSFSSPSQSPLFFSPSNDFFD